ncbi:hypothetical protein [Aquimarina sp. MMG016]|uniref:hypothetical protein n=1 Tax=Aquimarina sp. MMG016 TaxID=2822690 RepID=UPI001B3A4B53|nr:hypothetical protein [Aquimarina sp. MMG016]MBQ4821876.1 hypothetical protein [Aquimarina sp. MMG016]
MNEDFISGYLDCISRVKSIYTPFLGGHNCFFGVNRNEGNGLREDLVDYLNSNSERYTKEEIKNKIELIEIKNWSIEFIPTIEKWTCDKLIEKENGNNGDSLSEYLVMLLTEFLPDDRKLYKMNLEINLPWGDSTEENFLFETKNKFYILHFGESS